MRVVGCLAQTINLCDLNEQIRALQFSKRFLGNVGLPFGFIGRADAGLRGPFCFACGLESSESSSFAFFDGGDSSSSRRPSFLNRINSRLSGATRIDQGSPDQEEGYSRKEYTDPSGIIHVARAFRHTLLGGEITLRNIIEFAIGVAVAFGGFVIAGYGIDRIADDSTRLWQRGNGLLAFVGGLILMFGGAGLAVGIGFFGWWLMPFGLL